MSLIVEPKPERISFTFLPLSASESEAIQMVRGFLEQWREENVVALGIVFFELLRNATEYGNQGHPESTVRCSIERIFAYHYRIDVEDEGWGFECNKLNLSFPDTPRRLPQRGYLIVSALCDRLEFNDTGNHVTVYLCTEDTK